MGTVSRFMRNNVLGLPLDVRVDREAPFDQLPTSRR